MPSIDQATTWRPTGGYNPTAPLNGDGDPTIYRGRNMILRGSRESGVFLENWQGVTAFGEASPPNPVALTGTASFTAGSATITGSGTLFTQQLIPNQWILTGNDIWNVYSIESDTSLTLTQPINTTAAGAAISRVQMVMEVDNIRCNLLRGSVIRFPNGNFLTVGDGVIRFNGDVLSSSVTASKRLTLGLLNPGTSTTLNNGFTSYPLGLAVPTLTTLTAVGSGTKNMQAGTYSVRIVPERTVTGGYNNPSNKVEVTLTANQRIQITFPAMDTASGQDSWGVYVSLYSTGGGIEGPWYYFGQITTSQVSSAGGTHAIEYNDAEVSGNRLLSFDNDPPPDAAFIATLQGLPVLLSCNGRGRKLVGTAATTATDATVTGTSTTFTTDLNRGQIIYIDNKLYTVLEVTSATSIEVSPTPTATASSLVVSLADTAPGPVIRPAKPAINGANVEAFPSNFKVAVDPPENIVAWCRGAQGRLFVGTENYIHLVSSTGNPDLPVTVRPFWRAGVRNTQALLFVNDTLYAYTVNGPTRSVGDGDETIQEHAFASPVASIFVSWEPERVRVGYDPKNEAVCFFYAKPGNSETGFRLTECLMFMLRLGVWSPLIQISGLATGEDRIVTGVATVAGKLILCIMDTVAPSGKNFKWDEGTAAIAAYITTPFMDAGDPGTDKTLTGLQMTGYSTSTVTGGVWASIAGGDVPITTLEAGTSPNSGVLSFAQGSGSRTSFLQRCNVPRARLFAVRVDLNWNGSGKLARLDEICIRGNLTDKRY